MKFKGMYDDPLIAVGNHLVNLCELYNRTGDRSVLDVLRGAMNMAHTFGIDATVYLHPDTCSLIIVMLYGTKTTEVYSRYCEDTWPETSRKYPRRMPLREECEILYTTDRYMKRKQVI